MTGYSIVIVFGLWIFSAFIAFLSGYVNGRAKERARQQEEALRKAESDKAFEGEKERMREEVYGNAERQKAKLSGGTGRERFNAVTDSLRDNNK